MSSPSSPSLLTKNNFQRNDSSWLVELNNFLTEFWKETKLWKKMSWGPMQGCWGIIHDGFLFMTSLSITNYSYMFTIEFLCELLLFFLMKVFPCLVTVTTKQKENEYKTSQSLRNIIIVTGTWANVFGFNLWPQQSLPKQLHLSGLNSPYLKALKLF